METFIQARFKMELVNSWATLQKVSASNLACLFKNVHVVISNKVLELKEVIWLFARIAINSRPDMHLQECLSNSEHNASLLCSGKSKSMDILENISSAKTCDLAPLYIPQPNKCVAIIILLLMFSQSTNLAGLIRAKICQLIRLHLYIENMMNYILWLAGMTLQNHLSQQHGICGLVVLTLWHITSQTLQIF